MTPATGVLQQALDDARQRFVAGFPSQFDAIAALVEDVAAAGSSGPVAALAQAIHRLSGFAGTVGFPTVSARASDIERLLDGSTAGGFEASRARPLVAALGEAFTSDLATSPVWVRPAPAAVPGAKILVVEDELDQRAFVIACLQDAGYVGIPVVSGNLVLETARAERPALILLDVAMPGLDGYSVCRLLKADADLATIPVIFMTTRANLDDKLAGLRMGADEFLTKPVDVRELTLRIQLALDRGRPRHGAAAADPCVSRELTYDAFIAVAEQEIARAPAALAIVRVPSGRHDEVSRLLTEELRGRDVIGACGPTRVLVLMPEMTAEAARDRLEPLVDRLILRGDGICAGVSAGAAGAAVQVRTVEALVGEADEALAEARYLGRRTAIWTERADRPESLPAAARTVVVAEDDPDVTRIIDAQMRAGGFKVTIAFDGDQALTALRARMPDVLVLDLMMPKLNGFEVLEQIRQGPEPRPKIIVLSGRGREQDVMRAFEQGADDYMTKPFNPQELMARVARLLR